LGAGLPVYTSPATVGRGPVTNDPEANGFDGAPEQLPAELTVNAVGSIDDAGQHLAAFLDHLAAREGFAEVDLVCHSMGGLFARAAIRELKSVGHPVRVRSLSTLGTPWTGSFVAEVAGGLADMSLAAGDPRTEAIIVEMRDQLMGVSEGAGQQVTSHYLAGIEGWNERQVGVLGSIPVTMVAGDWFQAADGDPHAWPHDGLVSVSSALAHHVSPVVVQPRSTHLFPDVHSIFFADQLGLPWHQALTWNPEVFQVVLDAIGSA
jgi:pimeloyl-ACP methyl ester carboxylesterase